MAGAIKWQFSLIIFTDILSIDVFLFFKDFNSLMISINPTGVATMELGKFPERYEQGFVTGGGKFLSRVAAILEKKLLKSLAINFESSVITPLTLILFIPLGDFLFLLVIVLIVSQDFLKLALKLEK